MKFKMARLLLTALLWLASSYSFAQGPPTTSSPPGPPTIGIANAGDSSATVSFAAPDDNGGSVITGYTVTSTPGSVTATGISSPITVTDLNNGTSYAFTVRATNDAGDGAASSASNSVTPTGSLGGVPVCYITPTNAVIAYGASQPFSASCSNNPTGFQWKVNGNLWSLGGAGSTSSETFTGFAAGTYIVAVSAMNLIGTGSPANAILTVTPASTAPVVTQHPSSQTVTAGQAASFTAAASGTPTPAVQWQQSTNSGVSFTNISGATSTTYNFMTTLSNASYQYRAVFTNGIAPDATSDAATLTVNSAGGTAFPPNCQMPTGWTVPSGANAGWIVATDFASEGTCSLKSSPLLDSQKAQIQFVGSLAAGNVTFSRKVSSEAGYDCLQFYVDGIQQNDGGACGVSATSGVSGEVPWGSVSFPVTAGVHTLLWSYEKDASVSANQDAAWIDAVVLPGAVPAVAATIASPVPGTTLTGSSINFSWNASSGVSEYWLNIGRSFDGRDLFSQSLGSNLSAQVTGLPTSGQTLYVTLWSRIGVDWFPYDASYTAYTAVIPFPPNCQMPTGWTVPSGANAGWIVATDFASEGTCSLKSSPLLDSQKAQIQFVGSLAAGNVTFSRKVSSEAGYDCLQFYVDGIQQNDGGACGVSATSGVSGEVPWGSVSFPVTAGVHTLLWSYEKDASVSANQDAAWIDAVVLPGATGASLPTLSSVSPTTMAVNSGDQPLYLIGSNFQDGNVLQWQWDTTAGTWNSFVVTPASGSLLSVTMNPGAVARTMYLRVCRSTAQPTTADCSASASVSVTSVVAPFIDDQFNGTSLDSQLWTNGGNSVTIHNGYLDLQANQTDNTGWVKTTFPERQHIRVEMRHQMHAANGYFFPSITLGATNPNGQVTVRWLRSAYASDYCNLAANYDRVEILAGVNSSASCQWTFSNLVSSSYYDRWIVSILDYDVATGLVTLDTDSDGVIDFTATVTPANRSPITSVHLQGYGWNTGHLHQVDYIKVFDFDPSHLMLPQTISLGAAPSVMVGGTGVLNATSSSGLPVSFTVLPANGKCTVAGATVTGLAVGLCYVYVDQPGNGTYAPAPQVMQVFSVATNLTPPSAPSITSIVAGLGRVSINFTQPTSTGGGPIVSFSATCTAPGRTPRTSTGTGSQVVVRGLAGGVSYSCSLTASNGSYASVASVAVTVIPAKIDLTPILMLLLD